MAIIDDEFNIVSEYIWKNARRAEKQAWFLMREKAKEIISERAGTIDFTFYERYSVAERQGTAVNLPQSLAFLP